MNKSFTKDDVEVVQKEILHKGVFCLVKLHLRHRLFNESWSPVFTREILERATAAAILPYDPKLDRVILIEQFRPGALKNDKGPWQIEIPAGIFGKNEKPMETAIREAKEEANCDIKQIEPIYDYFVSPGGTDEYIYIYCGIVDSKNIEGIFGLAHENEDIRVLNLSSSEAFEKLANNEIKNAPAIVSLQWLQLNKTRLQKAY